MPIYWLTNKDTHARAVVLARAADEAQRMRPDEKATYDEMRGQWRAYDHKTMSLRQAEPLACWPTDLSRICVEELGNSSHRNLGNGETPSVLAFEADATLRHPGEGPDPSWGALFEELQHPQGG